MAIVEFPKSVAAFLRAQRNALLRLQVPLPGPIAVDSVDIVLDRIEFGTNALIHNEQADFAVFGGGEGNQDQKEAFSKLCKASHPNVGLINKLYMSLMNGDADAAASCYAPDAHFEDIAFRLDGHARIRDMWRMVCIRAKPTVTFDSIVADDTGGRGHWVASYIFQETKLPVKNDIVSEFIIENGFIRSHRDKCNALKWALQAYGFPKGLVAGLVGSLRRRAAQKKLEDFVGNPGRDRN